MILCLDLGNTRCKWALFAEEGIEQGTIQCSGALTISNKDVFKQYFAEKQENWQSVSKVLLSSVAQAHLNDLIEQSVNELWGLEVKFARVSREHAGVRAAYERLEKLGVDRWLALLAAWDKYHDACVVVDAGSAITVDYLAYNGLHEGGLIVPGIRLMEKSLFERTANVKPDELAIPAFWSPQANTFDCVAHGLSAMFAGLLEQARAYRPEYRLIVTGGDAQLAIGKIEGNFVLQPNLVLEGLYVFDKYLDD